MLSNPSQQAKDCYHRAAESERRAQETADPVLRQDFLDAASRWMKLARSYEFTDALTRYISGSRGPIDASN